MKAESSKGKERPKLAFTLRDLKPTLARAWTAQVRGLKPRTHAGYGVLQETSAQN